MKGVSGKNEISLSQSNRKNGKKGVQGGSNGRAGRGTGRGRVEKNADKQRVKI